MPDDDKHWDIPEDDFEDETQTVCPQCGGEVFTGCHDYQKDGGMPDCTWLYCCDCDWQSDPE